MAINSKVKSNYRALSRAAPQQTLINDGDYMTDEKTQQSIGVASDLNAELDTIKEVSIDVLASLTWFGRITLYVPIMILVVYAVFFMRLLYTLENVKLPNIERFFRKLAKLFFSEKSA